MALPKPQTHQFNPTTFLTCYALSLGQIAFGYPSAIISTTLAQPTFLTYFNLTSPSGIPTPTSPAIEGAFSGVFQAGAVLGILFSSLIMDHWGRKAGIIYCSLFSLLGGALLCGSKNVTMFIIARFFAGVGSWGFLAVTPIYCAELATPGLRGFFVGMNGVNIGLGYALATYVGMGFFYYPDGEGEGKWRGPLGLALVWPVLMLAIIALPWVPESPRWLLMKGRDEKARSIVERLHRLPGDEGNEFAKGEFLQMKKQIELDRKMNASWLELARRPSYRKRCFLGMFFAFVGQSTAVLVINNYGPILYSQLGYDTENQLRLQCGWITIGILFNLVGAALLDRVGRRPLMLISVTGCCVCIIIEAAMVANFSGKSGGEAGLAVGVAALYVFLAVYSIGVDCAGVVFYSELFPNHIRTKGVCLCAATVGLTDLVWLQSATVALDTIGWKFYLVFIIIMGLGVIVLYFTLPETKGIPLEEMARVFGDEDDVMIYAEETSAADHMPGIHDAEMGAGHMEDPKRVSLSGGDKTEVERIEKVQ